MTRVDIEALSALEKAAFRAPWTYDDFEIDCPQIDAGGDDCGYTHNVTRIESPEEYPDGQMIADIDVPGLEGFARANGELIVAMRNQLGAMLAELRAARNVASLSAVRALAEHDNDVDAALIAYDTAVSEVPR